MGEAIIARRGGGGNIIKSIQHGKSNLTGLDTELNISINAVDASKSIVLFTYSVQNIQLYPNEIFITGELGDTSVKFQRVGGDSSKNKLEIIWTVVEFNKANVQRGLTVIDGLSITVPIPITPVDRLKSFVLPCGYKSDRIGASDARYYVFRSFEISTDGEYINFKNEQMSASNNDNDIVSWQVVEF